MIRLSVLLPTLAFWAIAAGFAADRPGDAPFSLADLEALVQSRGPIQLEETLSLLPRDFRRNAVLLPDSRSLQRSSPLSPRALLSNEDGSFVLAFNNDSLREQSRFEMVQYYPAEARFEFSEMRFAPGQKPVLERSPPECAGCHGSSADPNLVWESFPTWPGAYGEDGEKLGADERRMFRTFLDAAREHPRYRWLEDLEGTHFATDASGRMAGHPNSRFTTKMFRLSFDRIAERAARIPQYAANRASVLATLLCAPRMTASAFVDRYFPGAESRPTAFATIEEGTTAERPAAFFWAFKTLGVYGRSFGWSPSFGDSFNESPLTIDPADGTATELLTQSLLRRDPELRAAYERGEIRCR